MNQSDEERDDSIMNIDIIQKDYITKIQPIPALGPCHPTLINDVTAGFNAS